MPKARATDVLVLQNAHIVSRGGPSLMDGYYVIATYLGI